MKIIIAIIITFLKFTFFTQELNFSSLKYNLLDSLILEEVNKIRDSLGRNTIHFSSLMRDNVSKIQTKKMIDAKKCFHPERNGIITSIQNKVFNQVQRENPTLKVNKEGNLDNMTMEVCIITGYIADCISYQDLANRIVERWCTSEPHKMVLEYYGKDKLTFNKKSQNYLVGSCSSKLSEYQGVNCIYATFHIGVVYIDL
jgi:hypothetical protein